MEYHAYTLRASIDHGHGKWLGTSFPLHAHSNALKEYVAGIAVSLSVVERSTELHGWSMLKLPNAKMSCSRRGKPEPERVNV